MADVAIDSNDVTINAINLVDQSSDPTAPATGRLLLYVKNGVLTLVDENSAVTAPLLNPMTTAGDIILGGTSGAAGRLAKGSDSDVLQIDPSTHLPVWDTAPAGAGGLYDAYVNIQDQKTQNTAGGTFTQGDWRTRDLNTEVSDTATIASVASNQVTLPAGSYVCCIRAPAGYVGKHQARLQNITAGTTLLTGTSMDKNASNQIEITTSTITGTFTLAAESALEVQHQCQTTRNTDGFGGVCNFTTEVYTVAEFWRLTA